MGVGLWYYMDVETPMGPVPWTRLVDLWRAGVIKADSLVRYEATDDWIMFADARKANLNEPPLEVSEAPKPPDMTDARGWTAGEIAPWRRYGARFLDTTVNGLLGLLVLGSVGFIVAPITAQRLFDFLGTQTGVLVSTLILVFLAGIVGGVVVGATATSVGKAIFGVRIVDSEGNAIGILNGLKREAVVWVVGLGFGIPVVNLFTMIAASRRLRNSGTTIWDSGRYTVFYRPRGHFQTVMNVVGIIFIAVIWIIDRAA